MISVIVPVYNGEDVIADCLKALLNQKYPKNKYETIAVDDGSTDDTAKIVSEFKKVKLIRQKHAGPATARNFGVKKSKGEIVLFIDADCIPPRDWIKNMVEPFKSKRIVGVGGSYRTLNKNSLIARFAGYEIEERHRVLGKKRFVDFVGTFSAAYRKNVFTRFGGFDTSFTTSSGEDPELSFRINKAGLKMIFQPKAFVYHRHPDTIQKFLRQKYWRGFWRVFTYKKHSDKMFRHSYTPKSIFVEEAVTGLSLLLLLFGIINLLPIQYGLVFLIATFLLTLPLSVKIFFKDMTVGVLSPWIIILRNLFTGIGIVAGILNLLFKKSK